MKLPTPPLRSSQNTPTLISPQLPQCSYQVIDHHNSSQAFFIATTPPPKSPSSPVYATPPTQVYRTPPQTLLRRTPENGSPRVIETPLKDSRRLSCSSLRTGSSVQGRILDTPTRREHPSTPATSGYWPPISSSAFRDRLKNAQSVSPAKRRSSVQQEQILQNKRSCSSPNAPPPRLISPVHTQQTSDGMGSSRYTRTPVAIKLERDDNSGNTQTPIAIKLEENNGSGHMRSTVAIKLERDDSSEHMRAPIATKLERNDNSEHTRTPVAIKPEKDDGSKHTRTPVAVKLERPAVAIKTEKDESGENTRIPMAVNLERNTKENGSSLEGDAGRDGRPDLLKLEDLGQYGITLEDLDDLADFDYVEEERRIPLQPRSVPWWTSTLRLLRNSGEIIMTKEGPISRTLSEKDAVVLNDEQLMAVAYAWVGRNVVIGGSAGVGKSTALEAVVDGLTFQGKTVEVLAPTNLAACNVNGETLSSYAGWTNDSFMKPLKDIKQEAWRFGVRERLKATDVIIVDEMSMVAQLFLHRFDAILREVRGSHLPFGGVQMIFMGDFCQLPPVLPFEHCLCGFKTRLLANQFEYTCQGGHHKYYGDKTTSKPCQEAKCKYTLMRKGDHPRNFYECTSCLEVYPDEEKWAFRSKAWEECKFVHVMLTQVHRQGNDPVLKNILQNMRNGRFPPETVDKLLNNEPTNIEDAIQLFPHKKPAKEANEQKIDELDGPAYVYRFRDHFRQYTHHDGRDDCLREKMERAKDGTLPGVVSRYDTFLALKNGMRVILLNNLNKYEKLVNGAQGTIVGFEAFDPKQMPEMSFTGDDGRYREMELKRFAKSHGCEFIPGSSDYEHLSDTKDFRSYLEGSIENKDLSLGDVTRRTYPGPNTFWPIVQFDNGVTRTVHAHCSLNQYRCIECGKRAKEMNTRDEGVGEKVGEGEAIKKANKESTRGSCTCFSRTQIPLAPGYAVTVHKSQGMTLSKAITHLEQAWEFSGIYVALSRVRELASLRVTGLPLTRFYSNGRNQLKGKWSQHVRINAWKKNPPDKNPWVLDTRPDPQVKEFMDPNSKKWVKKDALSTIFEDDKLKALLNDYTHDVNGLRQYIHDLRWVAKYGMLLNDPAAEVSTSNPPSSLEDYSVVKSETAVLAQVVFSFPASGDQGNTAGF